MWCMKPEIEEFQETLQCLGYTSAWAGDRFTMYEKKNH